MSRTNLRVVSRSYQHPRPAESVRSDPQGIDNLLGSSDPGIIRDGLAATISIDGKMATRKSGRMDRRRARDLQHPVFGR